MKFLPDQVVARLQAEMQTPDLAGTRYRAVRFLGYGGMGTVWLVEDSVLHRSVALKILAAENSPLDLASRLTQEAVILARLEHPGIVPVHDAGTLQDGRTFYCMKYVEGQTLDRHMESLPLRQRLQLLQRIAEPLAFAHSRGIIHRDLKPHNIMVGAFGEVLTMDWGLAKVMRRERADTASRSSAAHKDAADDSPFVKSITAHGSVMGTPGFMSPEQQRGEVHAIDQRTDVFGLGAILRSMTSGSKSRTEQGVSRPLQAICNKAIADDMGTRYGTVQEFSADIGRYLDDMPVSAYPENIFERAARVVSRNRVAVVLILAYLFMRLLFILFSRR
jgi:serine/threonine protein kinase